MMRVGFGYDLHRLEAAIPLVLGGVNIPHTRGLVGHSDADVLTHAIIDALLGAAALGNIGTLFPDNDPAYENANSIEMLRIAYKRLRQAGYKLVNIDSTIVAQQPKLSPYLEEICESLAVCLGVDRSAISVKVKTNERVGAEGREEAITTYAVALIERL